MSEIKIIKTSDAIYDEYIELTPLAKAIIDTPIYQYMRYIKQLAFIYLLYINANHTRFEHQVGTYYITKKWLAHIRKLYPNCITDELTEWIAIGGLCHDLGHGPFSHTFDEITDTKHEARSIQAFKYLVKTYKIPISDKGVEFIEHVIDGKFMDGYPAWYFELVCNKKNNLDSDKFDYLRRDMFYCNIGRKPPVNRIISFSRINAEGHICFLKTAEVDIETLYMDRYSMFLQVYCHPVIISTQTGLLFPMLKRISKLMNWNKLLDDKNCAWRELDDTLLHQIPKSEISLFQKPIDEIADWCFIKNCWDRISNRDLPSWEFVSKKDNDKKENNLEVIVPIKLNFTLGSSNPLKSIYWSDTTLDISAYDMYRQSSEEFKSRIHPDKYEVVRHLKVHLGSPLTAHYVDSEIINFVSNLKLPEDACIHSVRNYLEKLIARWYDMKNVSIYYHWEIEENYDSKIIIYLNHKNTCGVPKCILDFCGVWNIYVKIE
jgi:HD superfamily phosphohydrolase